MFRNPLPVLGALALGTLAGLASGQDDQADLKAKKEKKLASEFLKKAAWTLDFDAAKAAAKKGDKLIFAYFTRSYAP